MGTSGELIKIYPLLVAAEVKGLNWTVYSTGQSGVNFLKQWRQFELPEEKLQFLLRADSDLGSSRQALLWFLKAFFISTSALKAHLNPGTEVLVHGDTLSTLLGSFWAKRTGLRLSHVEAGLRSNSLLNPFPEEISRRLVSKLADFHFSPDSWSFENLKKSHTRGQIINTQGNTMGEALTLMLKRPPPANLPRGAFVLANIHRFENLNSEANWKAIEKALTQAAREAPVYMVLHPSTEQKLISENRKDYLTQRGIHLIPRMPFHEFAHWLKACEYLVTDGGSNQEECSYLGKPCLILRHFTERQEGLDANCVLSKFDPELISGFLQNPAQFQRPAQSVEFKPSQIILDSLAKSPS